LLADFNFTAKLKKAVSTLFDLDSGHNVAATGQPGHNVQYSSILLSGAEKMFLSGRALYPVERTLLSSGMIEAGCQSLARGHRVETPHVRGVAYTVPPVSLSSLVTKSSRLAGTSTKFSCAAKLNNILLHTFVKT
jgi:hypothetical protein